MITIIFGAGASFGSGRCVPKSPPLGNELFSELASLNARFSELPESSKEIFLRDGFEAGMATLENNSRILNPLQKELAIYLSKFEIGRGNAYLRLFEKLLPHLDHINLVTLNYDILIEQALAQNHVNYNYCNSRDSISLLKLHGSANFLPELPEGVSISGNTFIGCETFVKVPNTKAVLTGCEVETWCNDPRNSDLSPVLAMYAEGKRVVVNSGVVQRIQTAYSQQIAASKVVILIGVSYVPHDTHIWEPIAQHIPHVVVVNPFPEQLVQWLETISITHYEVIDKSFELSLWPITKVVRRYLS